MLEVGKEVSWVSQSQGSQKRKTGTVIAILQKKESAKELIPKTVKKSHIKFCVDSSLDSDRALVAVPAGKDGNITHYYCPTLSSLLMQGN